MSSWIRPAGRYGISGVLIYTEPTKKLEVLFWVFLYLTDKSWGCYSTQSTPSSGALAHVASLDCRNPTDRMKGRLLIQPHRFSWFFFQLYLFFSKKSHIFILFVQFLYSNRWLVYFWNTESLQSYPLNFECLESCTFKKCHIFVMLMHFL